MGKSCKDCVKYPFIKLYSYFVGIKEICSWRFMVFLVISQMFVKGILYRIASTTMLPIFKNMGIDAATLQIFIALSTSPWSLKPVVGVLSDIITIYGYNKRYWVIWAIVVGVVSSTLMFPFSSKPVLLLLCFVGINYEMAIVDLLTESKYAEKVQEHPESGSNIITFVNGLQTMGGIVAMSFIGYLSDLKLFWVLFLLAGLVAFLPLVPTFLGWLPETQTRLECFHIDKPLFEKHKALFVVVLFTGLSGPIVAILSTVTDKYVGLLSASILLFGSIMGSYITFPKTVANVGLYLVLARLSKPSISTALDYFFTADKTCLPDGPHFTFKYYITYTGILSATVGFAAVWVYQLWLSKWRSRSVLIFTTILLAFGGVFDLLIVLRVNEKMHISDHAFYIMGEAIFESVVEMFYWIPTSVIIAKSCPKNLESATYAFLAGISNFALMVSELSGAMIFEVAGVKKCDFGPLWWLILCFHILLPMFGGIPAAFLVPNIYQTQDILEKENLLIREVDVELSEYTSNDSELDQNFVFEETDLII